MTVVVDASVAVEWVIPEALSDQADAVRGHAEHVLAPDLLLPEAANALWKKLTRREITAREAGQALDLLLSAGLDLRPSSPLLRQAMRLARHLGHPVYDCIYLALAQAERATLITADQRLLSLVARTRTRVAVADLAAF
jgi:predicted nucleic acid-binding protein